MKNIFWPVIFSMVFLASCQSSRFMQDDMYFTSVDAKREVRQFEVAQLEKQNAQKKDLPVETDQTFNSTLINIDNYYDYSYASRIRRFNDPNNSWAYYDPYYTNYYWFNNSRTEYFGNSVYSTYSWWGPNFGNNYNSNYWNQHSYVGSIPKKNWMNPWKNNLTTNVGSNPHNPFVYNGWNSPSNNYSVSWNNHFCFNNMYYNSLDNNCYWWWWKKGNAPAITRENSFSALMQKNGISNDVVKRPDINYTEIKESYALANAKTSVDSVEVENNNTDNSNDALSSNNQRVSGNKNSSTTNNSNNKTNTTNANTSNTSKRWDNYNADVSISPNTNTNTNWSRSGVFSEGSRNNNYKFNGSAIPKNKNTDNTNTKDQQKEKDPKR